MVDIVFFNAVATDRSIFLHEIVDIVFYEIKINLGSEKTYQPLLCGGGSSRYILHLKSGKSIEYSGDYALCDGTPYGCKRYTKFIVDDLLKQVS